MGKAAHFSRCGALGMVQFGPVAAVGGAVERTPRPCGKPGLAGHVAGYPELAMSIIRALSVLVRDMIAGTRADRGMIPLNIYRRRVGARAAGIHLSAVMPIICS